MILLNSIFHLTFLTYRFFREKMCGTILWEFFYLISSFFSLISDLYWKTLCINNFRLLPSFFYVFIMFLNFYLLNDAVYWLRRSKVSYKMLYLILLWNLVVKFFKTIFPSLLLQQEITSNVIFSWIVRYSRYIFGINWLHAAGISRDINQVLDRIWLDGLLF